MTKDNETTKAGVTGRQIARINALVSEEDQGFVRIDQIPEALQRWDQISGTPTPDSSPTETTTTTTP